jgi:TRAP-type C4-dicarboxylate transport system permease small subunit
LRFLKRVNDVLGWVEMAILGLFVTVMFAVVFGQVFFRYVLNQPSPWTEELARYLFIWISMIGAAYGVKQQSHFGFEMLVKKMSPRMQVVGHYAVQLGMGILVFVLIFYGLRMLKIVSFQITPALQIPMRYVYYSLPVSGILMSFHLVYNLLTIQKRPETSELL